MRSTWSAFCNLVLRCVHLECDVNSRHAGSRRHGHEPKLIARAQVVVLAAAARRALLLRVRRRADR
eukprot:6608742-Prymnesium_polylepis.1